MAQSISSRALPREKPSKNAAKFKGLMDALPFLLPAALFYGVFILYPVVAAIQLSFFKWNGFATTSPAFVGLNNYQRLFTVDPVFWTAAKNSLIWMILSIFVPTSLGLVFAMALNQRIVGRNFFRTILYLPAVLAPIAVATMWRWMYNPNYGIVNYLLTALGLNQFIVQWLGDSRAALYSIFIASTWVVTGLNMVLFLAGLQGVPKELTEASQVDGAGSGQVFLNVTVPSLRPTFIIVIALSIINSLKVFDLVVGMTNGGPAQSTQVLALWSFTQSFGNHDFGMGNAIATILLIISLVIIVPYIIWTFREDNA